MANDSQNPGTTASGRTKATNPPIDVELLRRALGDDVCRELGLFAIPPGLRLSVVLPVYNERATLRAIVDRVCAVPISKEIILVDDGSSDGTREVLAELAAEASAAVPQGAQPGETPVAVVQNDLRVIFHERNQGKGAALRTGFAQATGDIIIIQDADLEYDPSQNRRLIQPIVAGLADVVYGSRFLSVGPHRVLYFWHYVANRALTLLSNMLTDLNLTDMETCYKVFRREVIEAILPTLKESRFGIDAELTAKVARRKYRIYELGVSYFGRTYQEGKKIGLTDACRVFWCIFRYGWAD